MERRSSIHRALVALVIIGGCYDEQAIELEVHRAEVGLQVGVKVCPDDEVATSVRCKPTTNPFIFPPGSTELTWPVHIVLSDESDRVMLKVSVGAIWQCGVITVGEQLLHYDVTVTGTTLDWTCDGACEPSAGCAF